jgi:hypothetical protein
MLTECGFVKITDGGGAEFGFTPSLGRIASLGSPAEIVALFSALHGPHSAKEAAYVLACLCDQEDASDLIGWTEDAEVHAGSMPQSEQIIIARHLMRHGIIGKAKPGKGDGSYSATFDASEYISAARVHLGLSSADAEALSMTEFQMMFEMKFPKQSDGKRDIPSREAYESRMAEMDAKEEAVHG